MSTPSGATPRFDKQVHDALKQAGAQIVVRCATCGEWHEAACPFEGAGAATPFVTAIVPVGDEIHDGIGYDGREVPPMVAADDAEWRRS